MASSVGLHARLTASTEKFEAGMKDVSARLEKVEKSSKDASGSLSLLAKIEIGKLLYSGLTKLTGMFKSAASGAKAFFDSTREMVDKLGKLANQTGMAVEPLQVLQQVAEYAGLSLDSFRNASQKMSRSIGDAQQGLGEAGRALEFMGLELDDIARMKPAQQFMEIGEAIAAIEDPTQRSAAAAAIFGRNGMTMIPMFKDLKNVTAEVAEEMDSLGMILSREQVTAVEAMNDAFVTVGNTVKKIGAQVIGNLAPMIEQMTQDLLDFVKAFEFEGGTGGNALADALTKAFFDGAEVLAAVFDTLRESFDAFIAGVETVSKELYDIAALFGYTQSDSDLGKVWEGTIQDIDRQMGLLHKHLDIHNKNIESGIDVFGSNQKQVEVIREKMKELESRRAMAMSDMKKAEDDHLSHKRKAAGEMGSALEMVQAMRKQAEDAANSDGMGNFLKSIQGINPAMLDFADAIGSTGVSAISLLTDPSKMVADGLNKASKGFYDLVAPLGITKDGLTTWVNALLKTTTPAEMLGQAGSTMVDTLSYLNGAFGKDLAGGVNYAAQSFLDILAPLGYTTEKILEMGAAAEAEANFKEGLIGGSMSAWDKVAEQMANQYISQGENPFVVYRKMMEERNQVLNKVTAHFDGLQEAANKTTTSMLDLAPSLDTIAKGMPEAIETAVGKFNTVTESIADYFGMGEGEEGAEFEEKDYTQTLSNSEGYLSTIATGIGGLGGLSLARIF